MFIALDECIGKKYTTLGCICLPKQELPALEKSFLERRLQEKCWGEIKWSKITDNYLGKYKHLADVYLKHESATFHSWTYEKVGVTDRLLHYGGASQDDIIFRQAYLLIRSVIWKCSNYGYREPYYIVADDSGKGVREYKKINELLQKDSAVKRQAAIEFCSTGNSAAFGCLQIADLYTGAVASCYDELGNPTSIALRDYFQSANKDVPLSFSPAKLPTLDAYKMHHCKLRHT